MHDEQQVTRPDFKLFKDKTIKVECLIRKSGSDLIKARGNKALTKRPDICPKPLFISKVDKVMSGALPQTLLFAREVWDRKGNLMSE